MRALIILPLLVAASASLAFGDDTFEAKAQNAVRINRIDSLVWAFTAPCDSGDDTQQRQCRTVRNTRAAQLAGAVLLLDADKDAFDAGAWSAQKKSLPLTLSGCVRCSGVEIDGKTFYVVTDKDLTSPKFEGGKLKTAPMADTAKQVADEAAAKAFTRSVSNARVQVLVKVPAKPLIPIDGKQVIALELVGYRVFAPCDGSIVLARPQSGPAEADKKQCGPVVAAASAAATPALDQLTPKVIGEAMKPVVEAAQACFAKLGVSGSAKLKLQVGGDGAILKYDQQGDFVNTPTGQCIDEAVKKATFPASKKAKTSINFPLMLQ